MVVAFTFPGGRLRHITIPATAGNVVNNQTPGNGKKWIILYARITLVNDASVASRNLKIELTDGTTVILFVGYASPVIAGQTLIWQANITDGTDTAFTELPFTGANVYSNCQIDPQKALLEDADQLRFTILSGVAGDSYSGVLTVQEIDVD